jgi:hypothetical protein
MGRLEGGAEQVAKGGVEGGVPVAGEGADHSIKIGGKGDR